MTKTLLKKQMMETFSFFWQNKKKNEIRTGGKLVASVILYLILFGIIASMFLSFAIMLCEPLHGVGMDWLYFALMGLMGIVLGAFGSIFSTYAALYQPKDNDLLLAMPVKPGSLLFVRLTGVYAVGLMYEVLVMIPALAVYYITARPGALAVLLSILTTLLLSIVILILSTVLGWVVALISSKTKHKSIITVVLSLVFLAAYYYIYAKAYTMIEALIADPDIAGDFIRGKLYPVYQMGLAATGDLTAFAIFTAMVLAVFAAVFFVLAKSYIRIMTTNKGAAKRVYKARQSKAASADAALLRKEARRFVGSPTYMLNCGLGIVFMLIAAVALVIKGNTVNELLAVLGLAKDQIVLIAAAAICLLTCMNDMTAPSVSLEGKNIWLVQSFPVPGWKVLKAKLNLHLLLTLVPVLLLTAAVIWVIKPDAASAILLLIAVVLFVIFMAEFGLTLNLLMPNLNWTNEIVPIKQSMSVMIALFGGWAIVAALGGIYAAVAKFISPLLYLCLTAILLLAASVILYLWLKTKGAKIFEKL